MTRFPRTVQVTLKEIMAMERVKEKMFDKRTGDGKHRLFVMVQTFLAQRRLQEAIAQTQVSGGENREFSSKIMEKHKNVYRKMMQNHEVSWLWSA